MPLYRCASTDESESGVVATQLPLPATELDQLCRSLTATELANTSSEDTPSLTSSSDDDEYDASKEFFTPPSDFSELHSDQDDKFTNQIRLPEPFYPPSITQFQEGVLPVLPRLLPPNLNLPFVPQEIAHSTIDSQDKYVVYLFISTLT